MQETMNAIGQNVYGGPDVLEFMTLPRPEPRPGDVLVRVRATSVNPVDGKVRRGGPAGEPVPDAPRILGWDGAGVVAQVGSAAGRFQVGDEVYFAGDITRPGAYAEFVAIDERIVAHKPASLSFAEAAAVPLVALTAWEALVETMGLANRPAEPGRSLLIVGGAGGVGSMAIQVAKRVCGQTTVIATASRPASGDYCRQMGADAVIDHTGDLAVQLKRLGLNGVDYILNTAVLYNFPQLVEVLNPLGHICSIVAGQAGKSLDVTGLMPKRGTLSFELMFVRPRLDVEPEKQGQILERVAELLDQGVLVGTASQVMDWTDVQQAHEAIETSHTIGKIVLTVS
jgi:NADPH:quinone reductase